MTGVGENGKNPKKPSAPNSRDARLAAALRENLRRRKAQERGRGSKDDVGDEPAPGVPVPDSGNR